MSVWSLQALRSSVAATASVKSFHCLLSSFASSFRGETCCIHAYSLQRRMIRRRTNPAITCIFNLSHGRGWHSPRCRVSSPHHEKPPSLQNLMTAPPGLSVSLRMTCGACGVKTSLLGCGTRQMGHVCQSAHVSLLLLPDQTQAKVV